MSSIETRRYFQASSSMALAIVRASIRYAHKDLGALLFEKFPTEDHKSYTFYYLQLKRYILIDSNERIRIQSQLG